MNENFHLKRKCSLNDVWQKMPVEWSTNSDSIYQRNILLTRTKSIKDFMSRLNSPPWYRGISMSQKDTIDGLLNALHDDRVQNTVHRVRSILKVIGLQPLPKKYILQQLIHISGGSDLAFLWFLMEIQYNNNQNWQSGQHYTFNEQLIMSCIAHLDMNFTLRGLDRLLPTSSNPRSNIQLQNDQRLKNEYSFNTEIPHLKKEYSLFLEKKPNTIESCWDCVEKLKELQRCSIKNYVNKNFIVNEHDFKNCHCIRTFLQKNMDTCDEMSKSNNQTTTDSMNPEINFNSDKRLSAGHDSRSFDHLLEDFMTQNNDEMKSTIEQEKRHWQQEKKCLCSEIDPLTVNYNKERIDKYKQNRNQESLYSLNSDSFSFKKNSPERNSYLNGKSLNNLQNSVNSPLEDFANEKLPINPEDRGDYWRRSTDSLKNSTFNKLLYKENSRKEFKTPCCRKSSCSYTSTRNLPYFQEVQPRKLYPSIPKTRDQFRRTINTGYLNFSQLRDPTLILANEKSRWFKNYELNKNENMVRRLLHDEIQNIIQTMESAHITSDQIKSLCRHHLEIELVEKSFDMKLQKLQQTRIKEMMMDSNYRRRQERLKRILTRLHQDVNAYRAQFKRLASECRKRCITMTLAMDLKRYPPTSSIMCMQQLQKEQTPISCFCLPRENNHHDCFETIYDTDDCNTLMMGHSSSDYREQLSCPNCVYGKENTIPYCYSELKRDSSISGKIRTSLMDFQRQYLCTNENHNNDDDDGSIDSDEYWNGNDSSRFCRMGRDGRPHQFDYRKIFTFGSNTNNSQMCMKRAFIEAIDSDISLLNKLELKDINDIALDRCIDKSWQRVEAFANEGQDEYNSKNETSNFKWAKIQDLFPQLEYYDPDNNELMDTMLKNALDYLKDDPRYVLASLPYVHRLPILREWIRQRYGKRYTAQELTESFEKSLTIYKAISDVLISVNVPKTKTILKKSFVPYKNRDYLLRKFNRIRQQHYNRMNRALMAQARILYLVSKSYQCKNNVKADTFFAYLPRHYRDIYNFRPWQSNERRNPDPRYI